MSGRWVYPLDPDCPVVTEYQQHGDDPIMQQSGCWDEFLQAFEQRHRADCERCQEFGAANVGVEYP